VRTFASAQEFLSHSRGSSPACLVLDVGLPGLDGLELQKMINQQNSALPIIFITGRGDIPMSVRAMKAGAVEFLTKPFHDEELLAAIRSAIESNRSKRLMEADTNTLKARYARLTKRERDILPLIASGQPNKIVAFDLGISEITVKAHRGNLMRKMKADSLSSLIRMAIRLSVVQDPAVHPLASKTQA
jgi:FixJ family two-component response regulator